MYNLAKHSEADTILSTVDRMDSEVTIRFAPLRGLLADVGVAPTVRLRPVVNSAVSTEDVPRSRPLTSAETKGLYALLGILAGSWIIGGIVNRPPSTPAEEQQHLEDGH